MQEKYFMKRWELACIILNLSTYKIFTGYGRIFSDISGPAAALTAISSGALAWLIIWGLMTLYEKQGGKTLIDLAGERLGKVGKNLAFGALILYLILSSASTLYQTGELIKAVSFPTAPLLFVFLIVALGAVICCAQGFDAIGRIHSLIIPISLVLAVVVLAFAIPNGRVSNLSPYLGYGAESTFLRGLSSIGIYGDLIILFMLSPFAKSETNFRKTTLISLAGGVLFNVIVILAFTLLTPYKVADTISQPYLQLVKLFSAGRFFQRIDGYFMYIASGCGILALATNIFFSSYGAKQALCLPKIRPLAYSLGLLVIFLSLSFENREVAYSLAKNGLWVGAAGIFAVTAVVIVISAIKRRGKS